MVSKIRPFAAWGLLVLGAVGFGCRTPPPPPPVPSAIQDAMRLAQQAAKLQEANQWPAASAWWERAARQFQLLNDGTNLAVAYHNQAACQQALGRSKEAAGLLEQAARLNEQLSLTQAWWRNQLALVQLESTVAPNRAQFRIDQLNARIPGPNDAPSRALLAHETARARWRADHAEAALADLDAATRAFQEAHDLLGQAAVDVTRAQCLERLKRLDEAETAWRAALAIFEARGQVRGIATALAGLGNCLATQGRHPTEASALLRRSAENFEALGMREEARRTHRLLEKLTVAPAR
jgi:tetratricopeptide (TPR) repeat protein